MNIEMDDSTRAFYAGVAAGAKASDALAVPGETTFDQRLAFFWLHVGTSMASAALADDQAQALFAEGAKTRAPSRSAVVVELDTDTFDGEMDPVDVMASALRDVAQRVAAGYRDGSALDVHGNTVGSFAIEGI